MVSPTAGQRAHSALVEIELVLEAAGTRTVVPVAQVGRGFLMTAEPCEAPPCDASLVLRVDGREQRHSIRLPDGISPTVRLTAIE